MHKCASTYAPGPNAAKWLCIPTNCFHPCKRRCCADGPVLHVQCWSDMVLTDEAARSELLACMLASTAAVLVRNHTSMYPCNTVHGDHRGCFCIFVVSIAVIKALCSIQTFCAALQHIAEHHGTAPPLVVQRTVLLKTQRHRTRHHTACNNVCA